MSGESILLPVGGDRLRAVTRLQDDGGLRSLTLGGPHLKQIVFKVVYFNYKAAQFSSYVLGAGAQVIVFLRNCVAPSRR